MPVTERMQWSEAIWQRVLSLEEVAEGEESERSGVFCYVSMEGEVDTHGLIRAMLASGRPVAVPRLREAGAMTAVAIGRFEALRPGRFGVLEPPEQTAAAAAAATGFASPAPEAYPIVLVPGMAFTVEGHRLGQGGGYYDRWLAAHPDVLKIGLCFEWQLVSRLPVAAHDRPMHLLVTERRTLRTSAR